MISNLSNHELDSIQGGSLWGDFSEWWGETFTDGVIAAAKAYPEYLRLKIAFGAVVAKNMLISSRIT